MNSVVVMYELMNAWTLRSKGPVTEHSMHRSQTLTMFRTLAKSEVDSKGVHNVGDSGWKRVSAIMDSGSAECVGPGNNCKEHPIDGDRGATLRTDVPHYRWRCHQEQK